MNTSAQPSTSAPQSTLGLGLLFGTMYFVQGMGDPADGMLSQHAVSLLDSWGHSVAEITSFTAILTFPWCIKPLFGLLSDFVPLAGSRRKNYLILASTVSTMGLIALYCSPLGPGSSMMLLACLLVPTLGVAFGDVIVDALMVEEGQPRGITGQLQSIQWASIYAGSILAGLLGAYLNYIHQPALAILICVALTSLTLSLAILCVRERGAPARSNPPVSLRTLWQALGSRTLLGVAAFLFLWNFNPFSTTILQLHMGRSLRFSKEFYGICVALVGIGSMAACFTYGWYCRRLSRRGLWHASIVLGIASTVGYWCLVDETSAVVISLIFGFVYMTATLMLLDLAAKACPPRVAGTVFAGLMAVTNVAAMLSTKMGGFWYEQGMQQWGSRASFNVLVGVGALFTAGCWLLMPLVHRSPQALDAVAAPT